MPEKTPRVLASPVLNFSYKARKTMTTSNSLAKLLELSGGNGAGADAAPARPMAITAGGRRQAQSLRPAAQLQAARAANIGILDLDGAQTQVAQLGQMLQSAIIRRVRPCRNAARVAHQGERLSHRQPFLRHGHVAAVA